MPSKRPAHRYPNRRLRRALIWGGVLIALCSATTIALGSKRIIAENAAFSGPATTGCVPSTLNRSDVLPGTSVEVSPLPDSYDASPQTQISLLGVPSGELSDVRARGSSTGNHPGQLLAYSQGDGDSFVPAKPFKPGERVTVEGMLGSKPFAYRFTVAIPDPISYTPGAPPPLGPASDVQHFQSRPELQPAMVRTTVYTHQATPGYIFAAPYSGSGEDGPMIFDNAGNLIWFQPLPNGIEATNLQVESYEGKPVLTWWQGEIPPQGFGEGEEMIVNSAYQVVKRVKAGNGYAVDLHEFHIMPNDTALFTVFAPIHCDLASIGGPRDAAVTDSIYQEIDLKTGLVRKEWHSLDHLSLSGSYSSPVGSSTEWPFDYAHLNSIDVQQNGKTLISARNMWALYELNTATGQVMTQIGGKHSSIQVQGGAATAYQHDATVLPDGDISVFDNGGVPKVHEQSRGIVVAINQQTHTERLVASYEHPQPLLAGSQGNMQVLADGNIFVGWGAAPWFSEFSSAGKLLFDAHLPPNDESYREYRFEWTGSPATPPAVAASRSSTKSPVTVYASWNGSTTVSSWRVIGGASPTQLAPVASAPRSGFETRLQTSAPEAYVAAQALNGAGEVIGTSRTIKS